MYLDLISRHIVQIIFLRKGDIFPFNTSVANSISVGIRHPTIAFFLFWSDLVSSKQNEMQSKQKYIHTYMDFCLYIFLHTNKKGGIVKTLINEPVEQGNGRLLTAVLTVMKNFKL